jgi:hypothetical protein
MNTLKKPFPICVDNSDYEAIRKKREEALYDQPGDRLSTGPDHHRYGEGQF